MHDPALVRVLNPNPRPLLVLSGGRLIDRLVERGEGTYLVTADLRLATAKGKSRVVLFGEGAWEDEEWVQDVGPDGARPHPENAIKDEKKVAHAP